MEQTVTSIQRGFSNSALRVPYAYPVLSCGHGAKIKLRPAVLQCVKCEHEQEQGDLGFMCAGCGGQIARYVFTPDPHSPADVLTKVGDVVECSACDSQTQCVAVLRQAIADKIVHHTRAKHWCGSNQIHAYRLDNTSPSNFMLIVSVEDTPEVQAMLRGTLSPLSPTEMA